MFSKPLFGKGQVTIPQAIRQHLGVNPKDKVEFRLYQPSNPELKGLILQKDTGKGHPTSSVSAKGQMGLTKALQDYLGIQTSDEIVFFVHESQEVILRKKEERSLLPSDMVVEESTVSTSFSLESLQEETPILQLIASIFSSFVHSQASVMYIEPYEEEVYIRFRIHGKLFNQMRISASAGPSLLSHLKIMAKLDIAEKRVPQDGRIIVKGKEGQDVDLLISLCPTILGETVSIRKKGSFHSIQNIGQFPLEVKEKLALFDDLQRQGILWLVGQEDEMKGIFYGLVDVINPQNRKVVSIENPVFHSVPFVNQLQVHARAGTNQSTLLKSAYRMGSDVLFLDAVRDVETLEWVFKGAQNEHLLLASMNLRCSTDIIERIEQMGISPYFSLYPLRGILGYQTLRALCPHCSKEVEPSSDDIQYLKSLYRMYPQYAGSHFLYDFPSIGKLRKEGKGCSDCFETSIQGNIPVMEYISFDGWLKGEFLKPSSNEKKRVQAFDPQYVERKSIEQKAVQLAIEGKVSLGELFRVFGNREWEGK